MSQQAQPDSQTAFQFRQRVLSDTGFCARNLLGWNYDEDSDHRKTNVGSGGIRPDGAHQQIVDLLDNRDVRYKFIQAPRGSYKSTILQAFIIRHILLNPDVRILYASATEALVRDKAMAIRKSLESDEVTRWFGPQRGEPWEEMRFTVCGRTQQTLQSPTFTGFTMESMPPGGRADAQHAAAGLYVSRKRRRHTRLLQYMAEDLARLCLAPRPARQEAAVLAGHQRLTSRAAAAAGTTPGACAAWARACSWRR